LTITDLNLAGSIMPSRLEAGCSLADPINGLPNPLAYMFDEEHDGVVRQSSAFATEGFWRFDPPTRSLVNAFTGQRVGFQERLDLDGDATLPAPPGAKVWRFQYEDGDLHYPLIVLSEGRASSGSLHYVWYLDHERSKAIWQKADLGREVPPFGLWQRVDACVADALLCWPEIEVTGPRPTSIVSVAGWWNGAWSPRVRRRRERGYDHTLVERSPPARHYLPALNASAHSWRFVDAPRGVRNATLSGVQEVAPGRLYLPAGEKLTGFEADVPYLRRGGGNAVMFPAGLRSRMHRGEDYEPGAFFVYADEEVFFCFGGSEFSGSGMLGSSWTFKQFQPFRIGLRHLEQFDAAEPDGIPSDLFLQGCRRLGWSQIIPSPAMSQRLGTALQDAWMA
jgi:hypothetical protein